MKPFNQIKINGVIYYPSTIYRLVEENSEPHFKDVYEFLKQWFNQEQFITAHTSGSTGIPKPIALSKSGMVHSATITQNFFKLNSGQTALLCLPVQYIAGKMMLVRACVTGFNLILQASEANPFRDINTNIDFAAITPYQLFHSAESLKQKTVRQLIVGGSAVSNELELQCQELSTEIYETYGMTETSSHIALRKLNGPHKSEYFTALPGIDLSTDARNCLVINAPHISGDLIITNDIVELIDNNFKLLGRFDRVINSGGIKIHPEQIEKLLEDKINRRFYITALPHASLNETTGIVIEGAPFSKTETDRFHEILKANLSVYQLPREIFFEDTFKYTSSGKLIKQKR